MRKVACLITALALIVSVMLTFGTEVAQAAENSHTVQQGDSLTGIAARYGLTVSALAQANGISNTNNIYAGQSLKVPGATSDNSNNGVSALTTGEAAYLVQAGESLSVIAARYNVSVSQLAAANKLSALSYVYIGQTLKIPDAIASRPAAVPTSKNTIVAAPVAAPANASSYTVQSGDSLSAIAARFGVTIQALATANGISNPNLIFPGQVLTIPAAGGQGGAPAPVEPAPTASNPGAGSGKWIDVNLSRQRLTAYEGNKVAFSSLVSTGVSNHPTVVGTFNIYVKYGAQAMTGGSGSEYYYLPNVPYVMYFYGAYAIHGTYWHNNFGRPMSHGCVNLPTPAAQFMYNWAPIGTPVSVHY